MLTEQQALEIAYERDTEKRLKMIDSLSEEDAKDLLRKITYQLTRERWKRSSPFDILE